MAKFQRSIRVVAVISTLASIITILVTFWTFGSLLTEHLKQNGNHSVVNDRPGHRVLMESYNGNVTDRARSRLWIKFGKMTDNFRAMVLGCAWMATVFGIVQLSANVPLILGSSRVLVFFPKYATGINFICAIFMVGCLSVPLTYNRECNESDPDYICKKALSISQLGRKIKAALADLPPSTLNFFWWDLTSYYSAMGVDIFILIFNVLFLMCAIRFGIEFN